MIFVVIVYVLFLFLISWHTSRRANDITFYTGNRQSPWYIVAYGMIGASLSGVTFLSQPGWVGNTQFSYMMMVFGYVAGYAVVALILLPLYYRLNLTSIYTYLQQRFGAFTYKTGASFFILSRGIGAALRMFLSVYVLDLFVFSPLGIPFWALALVSVMLVLLYTFRGGIRTIVWTDTLQTTFMLMSVGVTIYLICKSLGWSFSELFSNVRQSEYSTMLVTDWTNPRFFLKQFLAGVFITIAMTGLDQDMMQKNLSCRNLRDAQKNMFTFSWILVAVNMMFLLLGAVLFIYADVYQIAVESSDSLFATVSIHHLGVIAGIVFLVGLISAAWSSADGALTALTTSFCIDIIGLDKRNALPDRKKQRIRYAVHFSFAMLFLAVIMLFKQLDNTAIIERFFTIAGYTYGPLLGLYSFGLFTSLKPRDRAVPFIAIASPIVTYILDNNSAEWFNGYQFGFELLIVNGMITFAGLWLCAMYRLKFVYIMIGSLSLVLGTLGIFLPLLPTTPFYLLTAWMYMQSSQKLYDKVMSNKYFGAIVRDFQEEKSISLKTKIISVSTLWITISISAFIAVSAWWIRLILFAIAIGVTIHVLSYKTKKK